MSFTKKLLMFITAVATSLCATAQTDESGDMRNMSLDSVVIKGYKITSSLRNSSDGTAVWNMSMMNELPKILGNADPLHYTQLLPSVQTNNEYDGGLYIQGCDNGHNLVTIDGVPLYNVTHLVGLFSVFNASHYKSLQMQSSAKDASYANRLGGYLTMNLQDEVQEKTDGEFSVGLISSQGTLRHPIGDKQQLNVSVRASYLNLLYSQWLEMEGSALNYSFYDANLTYIYKPNKHDSFLLDAYLGNDEGKVGMGDYGANLTGKWGNSMVAAHWKHDGEQARIKNTIYYTYYHNRYHLSLSSFNIALPSSIGDLGFKSDVSWRKAHLGMDIIHHTIKPQAPDADGGYFDTTITPSSGTKKSLEASLFCDYDITLFKKLSFIPGLHASAYRVDGKATFALDPTASLTWSTLPQWTNRIGFSSRHQYLLQTGINSLGLPTTFWMSTATDDIPVQRQQSVNFVSNVKLFKGRYNVSLELYYKWLQHQQEYFGTFYDFINSAYDIHDMLHHGKGRNYGINVTVNKLSGKLTGWLSYSYGRSQRQFPDISQEEWYPSNHERIHELNFVGTQKLGKRWSIGMTGIFATGTPFTAPRNFQILNGNVIAAYGEHNANRLTPYTRIDLSLNYRLKSYGKKESGINFSVYNLTYSTNSIFYYMKVYNGQYYYHSVSFLTRILPSISYYCKF